MRTVDRTRSKNLGNPRPGRVVETPPIVPQVPGFGVGLSSKSRPAPVYPLVLPGKTAWRIRA